MEQIRPEVHYSNYCRPTVYQWACRRLPDYELILLLEGRCELLLPDTGERVEQLPGEALFIHPDEYHTYQRCDGEKRLFFSCIHFDLPADRETMAAFPRRVRLGAATAELTELFRRLATVFAQPGRFRQVISDNILKEILLRLSEAGDGGAPGDEAGLLEMTRYLEAHLTEHPGRQELATRFFLSPAHINRLFRRHLGETPTEYTHRRLAQRAYERLFHHDCSVKTVAAELGFANAFHFSRIFKKVYGIAPSHLRSAPRASELA